MLRQQFNLTQVQPHASLDYIALASNNTFVIVIGEHCPNNGNQFEVGKILHLQKNGYVIHSYLLGAEVTSITLVNPSFLIALSGKAQKLISIDLENKFKKEFHFQFKNDESDELELFWFKESSLICVCKCEKENMEEYRITLIYYKINQLSQPCLEYKFTSQVDRTTLFFHEYYFSSHNQGNFHSLIFFPKMEIEPSKDHFDIKLHDVLQQKEGSFIPRVRKLEIPQFVNKKSGGNGISLWQVRKDEFLIAPSNLSKQCSVFLINIDSKIIKKCDFTLSNPENSFSTVWTNNFMVIRQTSKINQSHQILHFLSTDSLKVEFSRQTSSQSSVHRIYRRDDLNQQVLNQIYFNFLTKEAEFKQYNIFLLKEYYMSMLLHINEDFDDDLLLDIIKILDCL